MFNENKEVIIFYIYNMSILFLMNKYWRKGGNL